MASTSPGSRTDSTMDKATPNQGILLADMAWAKYMGRMMNAYRLKNQFCDLSIIGSDESDAQSEKIRAHSLILSAASPLLKQLIDQLGSHGVIQVAEIPGWLWEIILKFVYTGEVLIPITDIHKLVQVETVAKKLQIKQMQAAAQEAIKFAKYIHEMKTPYTKLKSHPAVSRDKSDKSSVINIHITDEQIQQYQDRQLKPVDNDCQVIQQSTKCNDIPANPQAYYHNSEIVPERVSNLAGSSSSADVMQSGLKSKAEGLASLQIDTRDDKIPSPRYEQITPEIDTIEKPHFFCTSPISEDENIIPNVYDTITTTQNENFYTHALTHTSDIDLMYNKAKYSSASMTSNQDISIYNQPLTMDVRNVTSDPLLEQNEQDGYGELYIDSVNAEEPSLDNLKIEVNFDDKKSKNAEHTIETNNKNDESDVQEHTLNVEQEMSKCENLKGQKAKSSKNQSQTAKKNIKVKAKEKEIPPKKGAVKRKHQKVPNITEKQKDKLDSEGSREEDSDDEEEDDEAENEKKPRLPTVKCEECGKKICANYLRKHYLLMHKEKCRLLTCVFCDFMSLEKFEYLKHMRTHTGNKPHVCRECKEPFARAELLKDHIMKVHKHEKHKCKLCDKEFSSVAAYRSHRATIHEKKKRKKPNRKPKVCSICGHTFWMTGDLRAHEMAHRGEKPFKCSQCDLRFTTKSHLKKHEIVHTNEKPFMCSFCGFASNRKANLRAHERRHTGELPFKCDMCDEHFRVAHQLKMHKLKMHGVDMTVEAMKKHGGVDLRRKPSKIPETQKQKKLKAQAAKVLLPVISAKAKSLRMATLAATADPDPDPAGPQMTANTSLDHVTDLSQDLGTIPSLEGMEDQTAVMSTEQSDPLIPADSQHQLSSSSQVQDLVASSHVMDSSIPQIPLPQVIQSQQPQPHLISSLPAYVLPRDSIAGAGTFSMPAQSSLSMQLQPSQLAPDTNLSHLTASTSAPAGSMMASSLPSDMAIPSALGYYTTAAIADVGIPQSLSNINTQQGSNMSSQSLDSTAESLMSLFVNGGYSNSAFAAMTQQAASGVLQQPSSP